jgi:hypothetical protein
VAGAIRTAVSTPFDPTPLGLSDPAIWRHWLHSSRPMPSLGHTGYGRPLLFDVRKKLARMSDCFPPMTFEGKDRYDHQVEIGCCVRKRRLAILSMSDTSKYLSGQRQNT